jgi:ferredoxin
MKIEIDRELCSGAGYCVRLAPEIFELRNDKSWVRDGVDPAKADPTKLDAAEKACPWRAIQIVRP